MTVEDEARRDVSKLVSSNLISKLVRSNLMYMSDVHANIKTYIGQMVRNLHTKQTLDNAMAGYYSC